MTITISFESIRVSSEWRPRLNLIIVFRVLKVSNQLGSPASGDPSILRAVGAKVPGGKIDGSRKKSDRSPQKSEKNG